MRWGYKVPGGGGGVVPPPPPPPRDPLRRVGHDRVELDLDEHVRDEARDDVGRVRLLLPPPLRQSVRTVAERTDGTDCHHLRG